jgi:DNA-binding LacI/PurR family transcriptional regulator
MPQPIETIAKLALSISGRQMTPYGAVRSRKDFTQAQLMACLVLQAYWKTTFRGLIERLSGQTRLRTILGMKARLPHFTTVQKFSERSEVPGILNGILQRLELNKTSQEKSPLRENPKSRQKRVTIIDIATHCGRHFTTVAAALKGDPRVKPSTRDQIRATAQEMGYVPDPMLAALSAYRKTTKLQSYRETLAWVTSSREKGDWKLYGSTPDFHLGALRRAAELGFRLEELWTKESGMTSQRATQILANRGIRGLIIAPLPYSHGHLNLDWSLFSSVAIGYSLTKPRLHLVTATHYRAVRSAVRHLRKLGYERIGWVNERRVDERVDKLWQAGFMVETGMQSAKWRVPFFSKYPFERKPFLQWFEKYRPDVILTTNFHIDATPTENKLVVIQWLASSGIKVPDDVCVAVVNLKPKQPFAGILEPSEQIGRTAVDLVTRMIQNGERGVPEYPSRVLIECKWIDGPTVAKKFTPNNGSFSTPH